MEIQCNLNCQECKKPYKTSHRHWCYDDRMGLSRYDTETGAGPLMDGKEFYKIGRKKIRVLSLIENEGIDENI